MNISEILSKERLIELLERFSQLKVGVIGDFALDAYWYADMTRSRLSRETPHFPRPVVSESYSPGAGGNVAQNLTALGLSQVKAFSILGKDPWGEFLKEALLKRNVAVDGLHSHPQRRTTVYIKPILMGNDSRQEDARLDFENLLSLDTQAEEQLLASLEAQLDELDAVLISDQLDSNGIVTPRIRHRLVELAQNHPHKLFLADSRQNIALFQGMVLKPNRMEALAAVKAAGSNDLSLEEAGQRLCNLSGKPVFLTLGSEGVLICTKNEQKSSSHCKEHLKGSLTPSSSFARSPSPGSSKLDKGEGFEQKRIDAVPVREPIDVTGAGDTFFAALAACLAAGGNPWEAGAVANLAAAVCVEKINQTGTATPEEILDRMAKTSGISA